MRDRFRLEGHNDPAEQIRQDVGLHIQHIALSIRVRVNVEAGHQNGR